MNDTLSDSMIVSGDPRNAVERLLVTLCTQVLNIEKVGIYDNFFELGGDSLMATQFIAELQDVFPSSEPLLSLFFQEPTVASLSSAIIESAGETDIEVIADVIRTVMSMSEEEVDAQLDKVS